MKKVFWGVFIIATILIAYNIYNNINNQKMHDQEELYKHLENIAWSYYENLFLGNYEEALTLVDYEGADRNSDVAWLEEKTDYKLNELFEDNTLDTVRYDEESGKFMVLSLIQVSYQGKITNLNEVISFTKKDESYLIDYIISSDEFIHYRSNRNRYE